MKTKRVRAWCPKCRRYVVVELAAGELFVEHLCPQCGELGMMGLGAIE